MWGTIRIEGCGRGRGCLCKFFVGRWGCGISESGGLIVWWCRYEIRKRIGKR